MDQKTPEQIAAELELEAQVKAAQEQAAAEAKAAEEKAAAEELERKKEAAGIEHFVHEGKVYVPVLKAANLPGIGVRTALEICCDEESQAYLVKHGEGIIKEIL